MGAKTGIKKDASGRLNDVNVKQLTMGHWTTREMRRSTRSSSAAKRGSRKLLTPPPGGWTGKEKQ